MPCLWLLLAMLLALSACAGRRTVPGSRSVSLPPDPGVPLGECASPATDGVLGKQPSLWRADRDLDGDGTDEVVVADRGMCTAEGNCHWNLFRRDGACHRYLGTVSAARIQRTSQRGDLGFFGLRTWWYLTGDGRMLLQEHRFQRGGYHLVDALLCRQDQDDRVLCDEQGSQ